MRCTLKSQQGWAMPLVMVASMLMMWMLLPLWSQVIQATPVAVLQGRHQQLHDVAQVVLTQGLHEIIRPYDQEAFERRHHPAMRWMVTSGPRSSLNVRPGIRGVMPPCDGQRLTLQDELDVSEPVTGCLQLLLLTHDMQPWVLASLRLDDQDTGLTRYWQRIAYASSSKDDAQAMPSFKRMAYHYQAACASVAVQCAGWP